MENSAKKIQTSTNLEEPQLPFLLGDIPIDKGQTRPFGGINPHSEHFNNIGQQFLRFFIDHGRLTKRSKVLDVGCGTGRIAKALEEFLEGGKYQGFDCNKRFIEHCNKSYKKSFKFQHFDLQHDEYNKNGIINPETFKFPYKDNSFDFVTAIAVFNHLNFKTSVNYISEMIRVLRPQGVFFSTFVLLNQRSMEAIEAKKEHPFKFTVKEDDGWYEYEKRKFWNVALPEMDIRRVFVNSGMMIKEPIRYGEWCGSPAAITGHDIVAAIRGQWR